MTLDECFEKRMLRMIRPDKLKAHKSVEVAKSKLEEAAFATHKSHLGEVGGWN